MPGPSLLKTFVRGKGEDPKKTGKEIKTWKLRLQTFVGTSQRRQIFMIAWPKIPDIGIPIGISSLF
jgi:hypothetical protein